MTEPVLSFEGPKAARLKILTQVAQRLSAAGPLSYVGWRRALCDAVSSATGSRTSSQCVYDYISNKLEKSDVAQLRSICVPKSGCTDKMSRFISDDVFLQAELEKLYRDTIEKLPTSARTLERLTEALRKPRFVINAYVLANPDIAVLLVDGKKVFVEHRKAG